MSKQHLFPHSATLGYTTAVSLIALLAAGSHSPAHAQRVLAASLAAGIRAPLPVVAVAEPWSGAVEVQSPDELASKLNDPSFTGRILIPHDVQWDMSAHLGLPIRSGVSLIGERGALGSRPLLYTPISTATANPEGFTLFQITGSDVRIEGLHIQGPATSHDTRQPATSAIFVLEDPAQQLGRNVEIADNEIDHWTVSGVGAGGPHADVALPGDYDPSWPLTRPQDAGLVRIDGNYIHHNCMDNFGYGVCVGGGAYVTIEGNVFDFNRHDVTSDGHAHSGYIARFNYVLEGGFQQDGNYNQHFDVHGTFSSGPGHHDGGAAGEFFDISFNTIRGDQSYGFLGHLNRPAFELRGRPAIGAGFHDNILVHSDSDSAIRLVTGDDSSLDDDDPATFNLHAWNNQYGTDHSTEIAAGDFDGDGHTDVFLATGTAWFYSRGGSQPWTYLQPSSLLTRDLAFADIDNDSITDALWRSPSNGTLYYWKSGKGPAVALTAVPVPVSQLRFGDFDGDGKTDIFYTQGGVWNIWYGSTRTWSAPGGSSLPLSELLFGDFDGVRGTDILGVANGHWSYSSGGIQFWAKLNDKLTSSFAGAVVGDFDGDGRSDIAFGGSPWRISHGGIGPLRVLRDGGSLDPYASLQSLLLGHFDGGRRSEFVSFERSVLSGLFGSDLPVGNRLVIWRGEGSGNAFSELSGQEMR